MTLRIVICRMNLLYVANNSRFMINISYNARKDMENKIFLLNNKNNKLKQLENEITN